MRYLKDESYYNDLYDLHTIEMCLRSLEFWRRSYKEKFNDKEIKNLPKKERIKGFSFGLNVDLHITKGERYRNKNSTIQEWMEADRKRQEKYDNTTEPRGIYCSHCNGLMHSSTKILEDYTNQPLRVLFFFECPTCKQKRSVYDTGDEYISKPPLCPKCNREAKITYSKKNKVLTWTTSCSFCGYSETEEDDFDKKEAERKKRKQREEKLLAKYQKEFCLTDKEGVDYVIWTDQLKRLTDEWKEREEHKEDYDKVAKIKKLTVAELEELLSQALEKEGYIKLDLSKPEFEKHVIISFTVQDSKPDRHEYDSKHTLQKLIKTTLADTNWRLMSEGFTYRLGYLQSRLKAYETEEDLLKLVREKG